MEKLVEVDSVTNESCDYSENSPTKPEINFRNVRFSSSSAQSNKKFEMKSIKMFKSESNSVNIDDKSETPNSDFCFGANLLCCGVINSGNNKTLKFRRTLNNHNIWVNK